MRDQQINSFSKGMAKDLGATIPQEGFYIDGKNIRISTDGDSFKSAIVVSVEGNSKKLSLSYDVTFTTYDATTGPLVSFETVTDATLSPHILGCTYIRETLIVFAVIPLDEMPAGSNAVSLIYKVDLNSFDPILLYDSDELGFNRNYPIQAIGRYESNEIQRVYWTDNYNSVKTLNISANLDSIEDVSYFELSPNVVFNKLEIDSVELGGNLDSGMYQYVYRLKNSEGAVTRFSQPSNFVHIVSGSAYWDYTEDPENQNEYNANTPGETTNKKVVIEISNINSEYNIAELVSIYRTTSTGLTSVSIVDQKSILENGTIVFEHSSNENNTPISIEEVTAFNQSFSSVKTISEKDNRLFFGNVKQSNNALEFNSKSYRYKRSDDIIYFPYKETENVETYTSFNNPYNDLNNWWDDSESLFKYQDDGVTLGGTGEHIDFRFTKEKITGNTKDNTSESPPFVGGSITGDYKSPIISEKFKGYQRDEVYRFGILLYDKLGNPGFVNWIADIRFPALEDVDKDGQHGIYNYTIAQTTFTKSGGLYKQDFDDDGHVDMTDVVEPSENTVVSTIADVINSQNAAGAGDASTLFGLPCNGDLYALGIEFKLKSLPDALKDKVGAYSFVRVKRNKKDKSTIAVGALTNYFHYHDASDNNNIAENWYVSANRNLSYLPSTHVSETDAGYATGCRTFSISSPDFDFTDNYININQVGVSDQDEQYKTSYSIRVLGSMFARANIDLLGNSNEVYGFVYGNTSVYDISESIKTPEQQERLSYNLIYSNRHGVGENLSDSTIESLYGAQVELGQGVAEDEDSGEFFGVWNMVTYGGESGVLRKTSVGEKSLFAAVDRSLDWTYFLSSLSEVYGTDYPGNSHDKLLVAVKQNNSHVNRYGGSSEAAIASRQYIPTGHFNVIDPDNISVNEYEKVFGGDTYVTIYDITRFRKASTNQGDVAHPGTIINNIRALNMAFPVETSINTTLRQGYHFANKKDFSNDTDTPLNQFILNATYYSENDIFSYSPKPALYNITNEHSSRIAFSDIKINNSISDGWRNISPGNYVDIDGNLGGLNSLVVYNDKMFYLQDSAFGILSINPVSTITDKEGNGLVLGIGKKVIQDYKNISVYAGAKNNKHVVVAQTGVYWFDANSNKAYHFNTKGLNPISDSKLLKSYFSQNENNNICLGYDHKNNEVLYSMGSIGNTVVYNELTSSFTSTYSFTSPLLITLPNHLFSIGGNTEDEDDLVLQSIYKHNDGDIAKWYEASYNSEIEFVVNKNALYTKVFDNLEWYSEGGTASTDNIDVVSTEDSFSESEVQFNNEQEDNYFPYKIVKEKITRMPVPRTPSNTRFRDTYLKVKLKTSSKLILHYVKTLFRISRR